MTRLDVDDEKEEGAHQQRMARLTETLARFDTTLLQANELVCLSDYEIAIVMDDSSNMLGPAEAPSSNAQRTRWEEAKDVVKFILDIAGCFETDGVDVIFLNRPPVIGARDSSALAASLETPPSGPTPLVGAIETLAKRKVGERDALVFVITAGEPDGGRVAFFDALTTLFARCQNRLRMQIMACTADQTVMSWLNGIDQHFDNVDVTDDYASEKIEVERNGHVGRFTRGDWCLKAMLGMVSRKFDDWDETARVDTQHCNLACTVQ